MKVCVLGTSNAIFKDGYVSALRAHKGVTSLVNMSIGASSSNLFAFRREEFVRGEFDACIIDFCVNDTTLSNSLFQGDMNVVRSLEDIISSCVSCRCVPIFLMLPLLYPGASNVPNLYREVCLKWKVPFFDCYEALSSFERDCGIEYGALFEDPFHLKRPVARALVTHMLDVYLASPLVFRAQTDNAVVTALQTFAPIRRFIESPAALIPRKTSIVEADFLELVEGECLDLILNNTTEIVAVVADFARCHGSLALSGRESIRMSLTSFDYTGHELSLVVKIWPIPKPVKAYNNIVRVNIMDDEVSVYDFGLNHAIDPMLRSTRTSITLAGFIVAAGAVQKMIPTWELPSAPIFTHASQKSLYDQIRLSITDQGLFEQEVVGA